MDPYLYKLMQAHQAINDISDYDDVIERTINNFYVKNGEANVILDVKTQEKINAFELFQLGYYLLGYTSEYIKDEQIEANVGSVSVKLNLNSPGKIQLNSSDTKTIIIIALVVLFLNGGGLKTKINGFNLDLSTEGFIQNVIEYQNNKHDREMADKIIESMDSLNVDKPDDIINLLKQVSTNKDKPK